MRAVFFKGSGYRELSPPTPVAKIYKRSLLIQQNSLESAKNVFATISVSKGGVGLLLEEQIELANKKSKNKEASGMIVGKHTQPLTTITY